MVKVSYFGWTHNFELVRSLSNILYVLYDLLCVVTLDLKLAGGSLLPTTINKEYPPERPPKKGRALNDRRRHLGPSSLGGSCRVQSEGFYYL